MTTMRSTFEPLASVNTRSSVARKTVLAVPTPNSLVDSAPIVPVATVLPVVPLVNEIDPPESPVISTDTTLRALTFPTVAAELFRVCSRTMAKVEQMFAGINSP